MLSCNMTTNIKIHISHHYKEIKMININESYFRDGKEYEIIMPKDIKPGDFIRTHTYVDNRLVRVDKIEWKLGVEIPSSFIVGDDGRRYGTKDSSLCLRLKEIQR